MSTGQLNSGPMFSLRMCPDLVFRVIREDSHLERTWNMISVIQHCGKRWINNTVGRHHDNHLDTSPRSCMGKLFSYFEVLWSQISYWWMIMFNWLCLPGNWRYCLHELAAHSLDLNPIEHLWDALGNRLLYIWIRQSLFRNDELLYRKNGH